MMLIATRKAEQNRAWVDPWTVIHFAAGLGVGLLEVPPVLALAGAVAYEVFEPALLATETGQRLFRVSGPEVFPNQVVDVAVFALGQYLGARWNAS